jgi:hypothetical protein
MLIPYHRSLHVHISLVEKLRSHSLSFEDSRQAITDWIDQLWLEDDGWTAKWEDICAAEIDKWPGREPQPTSGRFR